MTTRAPRTDSSQAGGAADEARKALATALLGEQGLLPSSAAVGTGPSFEIIPYAPAAERAKGNKLRVGLSTIQGVQDGGIALQLRPHDPRGVALVPDGLGAATADIDVPVTTAHGQVFRFTDAGDGWFNLECAASAPRRIRG